ncbi:c6 zinc finger domain-containing protein [Rhypophila decipiens]|uniref:C6 zinc finger domain-containing protein n=1 Tax=Rhypophila decipiens TaxID=261697 RepID=A0AAN6YGC5_9PEZI|nr:c6 zinc finger domain-containing protein [Rhypophila decipiens]
MMASNNPSLLRAGCAHSRPSRPQTRRARLPRIQWTALLLVLVCLISTAAALRAEEAVDPNETLVIDPRIPVLEDGKWLFLSQEEIDLRRVRKRAPTGSEDKDEATTTFSIAVPTKTKPSTTTTVPPSPLPSPFDGGLSVNFTVEDGQRKCPTFINSFLGDATFKQCYPFSLLLQGSRSFFSAQRSLVSMTQVLDASCAANSTFCSEYFSNLATNMTADENCGADYRDGNSIVVKAYQAMLAYAPVYTASCLKDPETSMYCFANAVTNLSSPTSPYFYYLPLNRSLPGSSIPACNDCLQRTMNVFHSATADRKQQIANTYVSAAEQVNTICGPNFVNESLAAEASSSAGSRSIPGGGGKPSLWLLGTVLLLTWSSQFLV